MFEDSFVESQAAQATTATRWTMLGSMALQAAVAIALITFPLLHPERLSLHMETPLVFTPPPPKPPLPVESRPQSASADASPILQAVTRTIVSLIPHGPAAPADAPVAFGPVNMGTGSSDSLPSALAAGIDRAGTNVSVAKPEQAKRIHVSSGVSAGLLLTPIRPVYPAIAKAAGIAGVVIVEAVISKTGAVESLRVLSGPEMLRAAALDAIRSARYQPYRLNGDPTEVQTTFTVNFRLGA
ncbi:MAG: TonB family protein [Edaphobacter sp.]|uniref:energy transducer TonB n=1 Tax=Edaphobacter sp. TaxID=1934404 RepID=UPI0023A14C91|nr:energy transducer TonB [Edaphobacter sp.]MDE1175539.1 TonB family protein [Edaphobacter sp.]